MKIANSCFIALMFSTTAAMADSDNCMKSSCTALEERAHDILADHFSEKIDGIFFDDDSSCESPSALVSALNSWGFRAVMNGAAIFIGLDDGTIDEVLGTDLGNELVSAGHTVIDITAKDYVEEMNDRNEC